jgi:hypothetical protein
LYMRMVRRDLHNLQARYTAEAGLYSAISEMATATTSDLKFEHTYDFEQAGRAQVTVTPWGGYWRARSKGILFNASVVIDGLAGAAATTLMDYALVLTRHDYPLVVSGDTRITGPVWLGPAGVRSGVVDGRRYSGIRTVDGEIITNRPLPVSPFDPAFLQQQLTSLQAMAKHPGHPVVDLQNRISLDSMRISLEGAFTLPREIGTARDCHLVCSGALTINNQISLGPWSVLVSSDKIYIDQARLDRVLCCAPEIIIGSRCTGNIQLLSAGTIRIESGARLEWPSVAYASNDTLSGGIKMAENSHLTGCLILQSGMNRPEPNRIVIASEAHVRGLVFANTEIELKGNITGCVITNGFYFYHEPTTYINWLLDAVIDRPAFPANPAWPVGFGGASYKMATWQANYEKDRKPRT